ncbi:hypothetical protein KFE98_19350 [bacterium SCSIO 12741]|nr:hypothetical protein KFE98_19350 [bacterium SCSIO 12741]
MNTRIKYGAPNWALGLLGALILFSFSGNAQVVDSSNTQSAGSDFAMETFVAKKKKKDKKFIHSHGGFGATTVNFALLNGQPALFAGARGGWLINHNFSIGMGGYALANRVDFAGVREDEAVSLKMGYGGLVFERILFPESKVHLSFPLLIGGGWAGYVPEDEFAFWKDNDVEDWDEFEEDYLYSSSGFLIIEPGVEVEFNVFKACRLALNAKYSILGGLELENTASHTLDGLQGGMTLKFGSF